MTTALPRRRNLALAALCLLAFASPARSDDDGFKPLFNGKNLDGWVTPAGLDIFSVEDGVIVGTTKEGQLKKNEFLVTAKPYDNFILRAKVKIRNGNSGIQFRSKRAEDGAVSGPQADVADGFWGLFYEERGRGILERYPEAEAEKLVKKGDWNEFVITAKGNHVVIEMNGTKIIDRTDDVFDKTGIIALQTHAGPPMQVFFKDIEIKELD